MSDETKWYDGLTSPEIHQKIVEYAFPEADVIHAVVEVPAGYLRWIGGEVKVGQGAAKQDECRPALASPRATAIFHAGLRLLESGQYRLASEAAAAARELYRIVEEGEEPPQRAMNPFGAFFGPQFASREEAEQALNRMKAEADRWFFTVRPSPAAAKASLEDQP